MKVFEQLTEEQCDKIRSYIRRKVTVSSSGCWEWSGSLMRNGYSQAKLFGKNGTGHRLSYRGFNGQIPDGLEIDHLCKNRICVNPDHLEAVERTINNRRSNSASAQNARKEFCKRGHALSGHNLRIDRRGSRLCRACGLIHDRVHKAKRRQSNPPLPRSLPTMCRRNLHPYDETNTRIDGRGHRFCHACRAQAQRVRLAKKRAHNACV